MPPKKATVYTPSGEPTGTTVRVRNDGVVYKQDRPKLPDVRPSPKVVPQEHRFKDHSKAGHK